MPKKVPGLIIRDEQMKIFGDSLLIRWLEEYLQSCYPEQAAELGPDGLHALVTGGIPRARARGFTADLDIRRFVHVRFLWGPEFEAELPWAAQVLDDPQYGTTADRARALEDAAIQHLEEA